MGKPRDLANVVATGNILADGAVAPAELTGVTSTAAELNILDGVTATAAELNIMDGVTATTAELNHVDGVTSNVQTQMDTKAPVADPTFTGTATAPTVNASTALQIGGVAVTATAAELNKMDGVTVSASDINSVTSKAPTASPTFTGDAVFDTSTLKVDSSNNRVGVGTTVPAMILDVDGSSGANDIARFSGPNSGGLTFRNATSNEFIMHTATSDALIFGTAGNNERFRIGTSGQLGIGGTNYGTSGQVLTSGGSGAAPSWADAASGSLTPNAITSNTTATAGNHYFLNGTGITLTLPASPSAGDQVGVTEVAGNTDGVVARNSSNIMKTASDLNIDTGYTVITLMYVNASIGWAFA